MKKAFKTLFCILISAAVIFNASVLGSSAGEIGPIAEARVYLLQEGGFETPEACRGEMSVRGYLKSPSTVDDAMLEGLRNCAESIDISRFNVTVQEMKAAYNRVVNTHPDLFYVSGAFGYGYSGSDPNKAASIYPTYISSDKNEIAAMRSDYDERVEAILSGIDAGWSDLEKIVYVHEYLGTHYEYDYSYEIADSFNFLMDGKGVCQAYALTFFELMSRLGIGVDLMVSESMNHAWNAVCLNGRWYHVDVTWDDNTGIYGEIDHSHLMLSDAAIGANHYGWSGLANPGLQCGDTSYESRVWTVSKTPLAATGHDWYYVARSGSDYKLMRTDGSFAQGTSVMTLDYSWRVIGSNSRWNGFFSGLTCKDGCVIFNTERAIIAYDVRTGVTDCLRSLTPDVYDVSGIYGFTFDNGTVKYTTFSSPNEEEISRAAASLPVILDSNADGTVDAKDVACFRMYLSGNYDLPLNRAASDLNGDGSLDDADVALLRAALADHSDPSEYGGAQ